MVPKSQIEFISLRHLLFHHLLFSALPSMANSALIAAEGCAEVKRRIRHALEPLQGCLLGPPPQTRKKLCAGRKKPLDRVRRIDHTETWTNDHIRPRGRPKGIHPLLLRRSLTIWFSASRSNRYACGSSLALGVRTGTPSRGVRKASHRSQIIQPNHPEARGHQMPSVLRKPHPWWPHPRPTQSWYNATLPRPRRGLPERLWNQAKLSKGGRRPAATWQEEGRDESQESSRSFPISYSRPLRGSRIKPDSPAGQAPLGCATRSWCGGIGTPQAQAAFRSRRVARIPTSAIPRPTRPTATPGSGTAARSLCSTVKLVAPET